jgi:hypothetical protein
VGTPETVAEHPTSHTRRYLKQVLDQHPPEERPPQPAENPPGNLS